MAGSKQAPNEKFAEELAERFVAMLEQAEIDQDLGTFSLPWNKGFPTPINPVSGISYSGANWLMLVMVASMRGQSGTWATFKQWQTKLAKATGEEKPYPFGDNAKGQGVPIRVPITRKVTTDDDDNELDKDDAERPVKKTVRFKVARVFNLAVVAPEHRQVVCPEMVPETSRLDGDLSPAKIAEIEAFVTALGARVESDGAYIQALFNPAEDFIAMPHIDTFESASAYYSTLLHEIGHWVGHPDRANIESLVKGATDPKQYGIEELRAEITSAMLGSHFGIEVEPRKDHVQYLNSWISTLKAEPSILLTVAASAQRGYDHLHQIAETEKAH